MNMTRIKKLRTQLHLSQEYVANYLGLSRSTYTQMENGKRKVLADEVAKLSDLFGVSTDSLLNDTNGMAIEALKVVEPKHGKWIPCSERLPEKDGSYLVCMSWGYYDMNVYMWADGWNCIRRVNGEIDRQNEIDGADIIAWMPLPEPYREESEVEK